MCVYIYIYMIDRITYMLLWYIIYHQNIFVFPFENTGFFRKYLLFCKYGVQMWLEDLPVDIAPIHYVWLLLGKRKRKEKVQGNILFWMCLDIGNK